MVSKSNVKKITEYNEFLKLSYINVKLIYFLLGNNTLIFY